MNLTRRTATVGGLTLLGTTSLSTFARADWGELNLGEGLEEFWLATDAYIYGYPLVTMEMTRRVMTNVATPQATRAPMGQLLRARSRSNRSPSQIPRHYFPHKPHKLLHKPHKLRGHRGEPFLGRYTTRKRNSEIIKHLYPSEIGVNILRNRRTTHGSGPRYPPTRYEPSPLVDLSTRSERERLSLCDFAQ